MQRHVGCVHVDSVLGRELSPVVFGVCGCKCSTPPDNGVIRGGHANTALMNVLQHKLQTALYFSALNAALLPVHPQTRRAQLLLEQPPLLQRVARWYDKRGIGVYVGYMDVHAVLRHDHSPAHVFARTLKQHLGPDAGHETLSHPLSRPMGAVPRDPAWLSSEGLSREGSNLSQSFGPDDGLSASRGMVEQLAAHVMRLDAKLDSMDSSCRAERQRLEALVDRLEHVHATGPKDGAPGRHGTRDGGLGEDGEAHRVPTIVVGDGDVEGDDAPDSPPDPDSRPKSVPSLLLRQLDAKFKAMDDSFRAERQRLQALVDRLEQAHAPAPQASEASAPAPQSPEACSPPFKGSDDGALQGTDDLEDPGDGKHNDGTALHTGPQAATSELPHEAQVPTVVMERTASEGIPADADAAHEPGELLVEQNAPAHVLEPTTASTTPDPMPKSVADPIPNLEPNPDSIRNTNATLDTHRNDGPRTTRWNAPHAQAQCVGTGLANGILPEPRQPSFSTAGARPQAQPLQRLPIASADPAAPATSTIPCPIPATATAAAPPPRSPRTQHAVRPSVPPVAICKLQKGVPAAVGSSEFYNGTPRPNVSPSRREMVHVVRTGSPDKQPCRRNPRSSLGLNRREVVHVARPSTNIPDNHGNSTPRARLTPSRREVAQIPHSRRPDRQACNSTGRVRSITLNPGEVVHVARPISPGKQPRHTSPSNPTVSPREVVYVNRNGSPELGPEL